MKRIIIIGAPMSGKTTYASTLNIPHYCTDPKHLSREKSDKINYMPQGLKWGDDSEFVVSQWFNKPGPWVIEGVGAVRALRKFAQKYPYSMPCDEIIVMMKGEPETIGQKSMGKSVMSIWGEVASKYVSITKHIY